MKSYYFLFYSFIIFFCCRCSGPLAANVDGTELSPDSGSSIGSDSNEFLSLGQSLYAKNCASCHGSLELSSIKDVSAPDIQSAFQSVPQMIGVANLGLDITAIANALSTSQQPPAITASAPKFSCDQPEERGLANNGSRRLTQFEIKQTLRHLFGEQAYQQLKSIIEIYPQEAFYESVGEFDGDINASLFESMAAMIRQMTQIIASNNQYIANSLASCLIDNTNQLNLSNRNCRESFINNFGLKVFRRPLSQEQKEIFLSILTSQESFYTSDQERLEDTLQALFLSPEFFTLHSKYGENSDSRGRLDSYSIASKMSFSSAGTMPDTELLEAAARNQLLEISQRQYHSDRLISSTQGRRHIRNLFYHILHLNKVSTPRNTYGDTIGISSQNLIQDLTQEALDFAEHLVFEEEGSFGDLMSSEKAFPPSENSARLFASDVSSGINDPQVSLKQHRGIFMRPILMLSPEPRTSPISRGVFITRRVLCNEIPEPDPDAVAQGEMLLQEIDALTLSAREQAQHVTAAKNCQSCHQYINGPGFVLEQFGSFGDFRTEEFVYNAQNQLVRKLPIDAQVDDFNLDNELRSLASAEEYTQAIADSTQGRACFAQNIFRYTNYRKEIKSDNCHLSETEGIVRKQSSVKEIIIHNAISEDQLWERID